ncbi:MAG: hypothetical protein LBR23_04605 [Spirochaetaceae bacterium]|jgi:hypothetical protein|nr:hypothetical protein [Spirochaetaceae bacterium]
MDGGIEHLRGVFPQLTRENQSKALGLVARLKTRQDAGKPLPEEHATRQEKGTKRRK